ncbi:MAG: YegS/Rv2252/BmrU family lipid kinase, partial [Bacteroidota bacterium]
MRKYTFILNPSAGKGAARKLRSKLFDAIRSRTSDFEFHETNQPGDATEIARQTASPIVVAIGGDGTVHEVANGIIGSEKVLGIVPVGSGNDFIKSIGVPREILSSLSCIFRHQTRIVDAGRVEVRANRSGLGGNSSVSHFVNGVGIGFDAAVAEKTRRINYASGTLLYLIAVLQTLGKYKSPDFTISIDGRQVRSRNLLIAVGNGVCAGGGFYLTPDA